jgi:hypothetical protein
MTAIDKWLVAVVNEMTALKGLLLLRSFVGSIETNSSLIVDTDAITVQPIHYIYNTLLIDE